MNKRIQLLAEQATTYIEPKATSGEGWIFDQEKFAELIVRECADVALQQKKWVEDQRVHNTNDERWNRARIQQSQLIVDKIRQHWGVET